MELETRIAATEFKAKCLKLLDDVAARGESMLITKHGEPIARLVPVERPRTSLFGGWEKRLRINGDIVSIDTSDDWDAVR